MSHADLLAESLDVAEELAGHGYLIGARYRQQVAAALADLEWQPVISHLRSD